MKDMIVTADEAVALIRDGDSVCCSGFVGLGAPDESIMALQRRFTGPYVTVVVASKFSW